jgi:hypothetical protein
MKSLTITTAVKSLSIPIVMHFGLAIFTLGDSTVFVSSNFFDFKAQVTRAPDNIFVGYDTLVQAAAGASQEHMLPCVVALCVFSAVLILYTFPTSPLLKLVTCVRIYFGQRNRRVSEHNPPFTSPYIKPVIGHHYHSMSSWSGALFRCFKWVLLSSSVQAGNEEMTDKTKLSDAQKLSGWILKEEKITHGKFKMKEWKKTGFDDQGVKHEAGELKRTWECIRDGGLHSYRMDINPRYKAAMQTMYSASRSKKKYL